MSKINTINIIDIIGSNMADDKIKGEKIFNEVNRLIENDEEIINIDFTDIDGLNTAFLNDAIGKIFSITPEKRRRVKITLMNFPDELKDILQDSIETARDKYM